MSVGIQSNRSDHFRPRSTVFEYNKQEAKAMSTFMRAKFQVSKVERFTGGMDVITCGAVSRSDGYPADGIDEDNTYAKFSPQGALTLTIANPVLIGKIEPGQKFYLDFTKVE